MGIPISFFIELELFSSVLAARTKFSLLGLVDYDCKICHAETS